MKKLINRARSLRRKQTPHEVILWSRLRGRKFFGCKFRRQYPFHQYILDFVCLEKKIVIELDGSGHQDQKEYDMIRDGFLNAHGFVVLRVWDNEINRNLEGVLQKIESVLFPHP